MKIGAERETVEKKSRFARFGSGARFVCKNDEKSMKKTSKKQRKIHAKSMREKVMQKS